MSICYSDGFAGKNIVCSTWKLNIANVENIQVRTEIFSLQTGSDIWLVHCPQRQAHGGQAPAAAGQGQGHDHEGPPVHGDADYEWLADLLGASYNFPVIHRTKQRLIFVSRRLPASVVVHWHEGVCLCSYLIQ